MNILQEVVFSSDDRSTRVGDTRNMIIRSLTSTDDSMHSGSDYLCHDSFNGMIARVQNDQPSVSMFSSYQFPLPVPPPNSSPGLQDVDPPVPESTNSDNALDSTVHGSHHLPKQMIKNIITESSDTDPSHTSIWDDRTESSITTIEHKNSILCAANSDDIQLKLLIIVARAFNTAFGKCAIYQLRSIILLLPPYLLMHDAPYHQDAALNICENGMHIFR